MKFQPYNNIIYKYYYRNFLMYSMRFRFTEYLNTRILLGKRKEDFSLAGTGRFVSFAV